MKQLYRVNSQRISKRIGELSEIGKTIEGGVTRKALTKEDFEAQKFVSGWMREAGLTIRTDPFGNLIGRREGRNPSAPVVMIGSHIDTVPNGGNFDGTIGVIGGIEVAQIIHEEHIPIEHPIEIVAFSDEEGTRFQGGLFGSRGMVGKIRDEELSFRDEEGISRLEALEAVGFSSFLNDKGVKKRGDVKVYLEMHIEQGPYLEKIQKPVGIVTGIAGAAWLGIKIIGESGHAGTVPMQLRKDPMAGASEIIWNVEKICSQEPSAPTVGTVGKLAVRPGGTNVIPLSVEFTVDIRDIDLKRRNRRLDEVKDTIRRICEQRGLSFEIIEHLIQSPVYCADHVIQTMEKAGKTLNLDVPTMISGAGHDAMSMSEITNIGMIFVRCLGGISHNPKEWSEINDISKGASLLLETALQHL